MNLHQKDRNQQGGGGRGHMSDHGLGEHWSEAGTLRTDSRDEETEGGPDRGSGLSGSSPSSPVNEPGWDTCQLHPASSGAPSLDLSGADGPWGWAVVPGGQPSGSDSSAGCFPASE